MFNNFPDTSAELEDLIHEHQTQVQMHSSSLADEEAVSHLSSLFLSPSLSLSLSFSLSLFLSLSLAHFSNILNWPKDEIFLPALLF